ncbi:MAG: outer membrane lipoprotein carrier protein LolA [Ginsengibacter sp.]
MTKNFFFIYLILSGFTSFSQTAFLGKSDPDAKKILDNVSSKFKTYKSLTAKFNLKIENGENKVLGTKSGTVYMKGNQYRISLPGQEIYGNGNNVWTYDKDANEVQITPIDPTANMITPQKMFTNFYDKDFLYKLNENSDGGKKGLQQIELTPVDKTKAFFKVLVDVDKASQSIKSTKVFEKNGNKYTYNVLSMQANNPLPESLFAFNLKDYPNVEVVDLR